MTGKESGKWKKLTPHQKSYYPGDELIIILNMISESLGIYRTRRIITEDD
jgi:hypothetical protein